MQATLVALGLSAPSVDLFPARGHGPDAEVAIATFVSNHAQERLVRALVESVRRNGGKYANCPIYVVTSNPREWPCRSLPSERVVILPLEMEDSLRDYPLALKAFAASQVERRVKGAVGTLMWLDPGVIVLHPPSHLDLGGEYDAALRPVTLANTIGLEAGRPPDDYWEPIFRKTGLNPRTLPSVETVVEGTPIMPYYNCEVFSFNPGLGLAAQWAGLLEPFLKDDRYQKTVCTTFLRRLFLHQAVWSAVVAARVAPGRLRPLPLSSGYPFSQHGRLRPPQRAGRLNDLSVVIFDDAWDRRPGWLEAIPVDDPLKSWLFRSCLEYMEVAPHIYRVEGSCNSYLVTTGDGSVLVDPAGAAVAPEYFQALLERHPLKAILLTHAHPDHSNDIARWRMGKPIPVIAQREYDRQVEYAAELGGFFARRNAIWAGTNPGDGDAVPETAPERPTSRFIDEYGLTVGELTFRLKHTPGETPDQTTIFIPELKAVFVGDNYYEYFINNSTFRGTLIRPVRGYIRALDEALAANPVSWLPGHGRPLLSPAEILEEAGGLRDALKYVYDETVRGINSGKDLYSLMREIRLPDRFRVGQHYGKVEWTVRGIWQEYVGWFDENPATMYPFPFSDLHPDLEELAGTSSILDRARHYLVRKEYVKVLHLTEIILRSRPRHRESNEMRRDALMGLKAQTRNHIEGIWLNYALRLCERNLEIAPPGVK